MTVLASVLVGACGESPTLTSEPPTLDSVTPDTVPALDSVTLTLAGTRFEEGSVVTVGGRRHLAQFVSHGTLELHLPQWATFEPGVYPLSVSAPGWGAPASAPLELVILPRAPRITALSPSSVVAGSPTFELIVSGLHFDSTSQVFLNGAQVPTTHQGPGRLSVSVPAADVASAGAVSVAVSNAGAAPSLMVGLAVAPGTPSIHAVDSLRLATRELATDPVRDVVYAIVPPGAPERSNELVAIDPGEASIVWGTQLGSRAEHLVVTDDGSYAYVSLPDEHSVARIDLESRSVVLTIPLPIYDWSEIHPPSPTIAMDIEPVPGLPRTIIVPLAETCCTPKRAGTIVLDDAVERPIRSGGHRVEADPRGDVVYTVGSGGFSKVRLVPNGIRFVESVSLASSDHTDIVEDGGWVFSGDGWMMDGEYLMRLVDYPLVGHIRPDTRNGRVHFFSGTTLRTFQYRTGDELGSLPLPEAEGSSALVRFGMDGMAFGGTDRVIFLRSDLIGG